MMKLYIFLSLVLLIILINQDSTATELGHIYRNNNMLHASTILECTLNIARSAMISESVFGIVQADADKKLPRHINDILIELMKNTTWTILSFNAASYEMSQSTVSHRSAIPLH